MFLFFCLTESHSTVPDTTANNLPSLKECDLGEVEVYRVNCRPPTIVNLDCELDVNKSMAFYSSASHNTSQSASSPELDREKEFGRSV